MAQKLAADEAGSKNRWTGTAVIIRKNSYGNRSERGADTQAVLMSIYRTLKQRGHDPLTTITTALAEYLNTGKLSGLPP